MPRTALALATMLVLATTAASAQQGSIGIFPATPPMPGLGPPQQRPAQPGTERQPPPAPTPGREASPAPQQPPPQPRAQPQPQQPAPERRQPPPGQPPQGAQPAPGQPPAQRTPPTARQGTPQSFAVTVHGTEVRVPAAEGHCGLDQQQAFDKSIIDSIRTNAGDSVQVLAITMNCDAIVAARAGRETGGYVYAYNTTAQASNVLPANRATFTREVCQRAAENPTPTRGNTAEERAAELDTFARANQQATAILRVDGNVCFIGNVRVSPNESGGSTVVSEVVAITVVRSRVVIISFNSINADALPGMVPRAESEMRNLFLVNGER